MKTANSVLLATTLALLSADLKAQGPDASLLPADTAFVVHVDVQRLAGLIGVEDLLEQLSDSEAREVSDMLRQIERRLGFDPIRDIRSVTVFGSDLTGDEPSVMLITDDSLDDALEALDDEGALRTERDGGLRFQRINAAGVAAALGIEDVDASEDDSLVLYVQRIGNNRRAVLFGERTRDILDAARVLDDDELSLGQTRRPALNLQSSNGSFLYFEVSSSLEDIIRETPASELASKVRGLALDLSEEQDMIDIRLTVATASRRDASDVEDLITGLRGLISLAGDMEDIPDIVRSTLDGIRADADGDRVTVRLSVPFREIRRMLEEAMR